MGGISKYIVLHVPQLIHTQTVPEMPQRTCSDFKNSVFDYHADGQMLFCPEVPAGHFQKLFPALYMFKLVLKQYFIPFFAVFITDSTILVKFLTNFSLQNIRLNRARNRTVQEMNDGIKEKIQKFDKEKQQLAEKNKQLLEQVDQLTGQLEEATKRQKQQQEELKDMRQSKDLLTQVLNTVVTCTCTCTYMYETKQRLVITGIKYCSYMYMYI